MSVDHNAVVQTFHAELARLDESILSKIRWENEADDPTGVQDFYVEATFLPYAETPVGSGYDRLTGELRLAVMGPRGRGVDDLRQVALQLKALFRAGQSLVGETVVVVLSCEILSGRSKDEMRYALPVVVSFRSDALRDRGV